MSLAGRAFARVRPRLPMVLRDPPELFLAKNSALRTTGWLRSRREHASVDDAGEPIPWITYAAMRFLEPRVGKDLRVFEFGSGYSTLWWAKRVNRVVAVEHDAEWHKRMADRVPVNADLRFAVGDDYIRSAIGETYDIIVNDGIRRPDCAIHSVKSLRPGGVYVWDNTNERADEDGHRYLEQAGFKRLDFWGMCPLMVMESCTSVFYREKNCLAI
jgi:predicted O-methyltransferase YrrM